ncbi:unnamed protein product, partial [Mesorhabditis belari]|uniref:glucuronosyltransferase n=1 Tax=Mesorhabditis belari TaxID=2138241 RepID=A0AAF3EDW4_9BILA
MSRVADILGEAGHKVTYLEPLFVEKVAAKGPINRNVQIIEVPRSKFIIHLFTAQKSDSSGSARWETTTLTDFWVTKKYIDLLRVAALDSLERIITDEMMMNRLKALQFDVAITQPVEWSGYGLFYRLGLKKYLTVFSTSPGMTYSTIFGAPYAISYAPAMLSRKNERMSFYDRAMNFVYTLMEKPLFDGGYTPFDDLLTRNDPEFPSIRELVIQSSFFLPNSEPLIDFPKPKLSKIAFIGGLTVSGLEKREKLNEEFDEILNQRAHTIFISFGSMARSVDMPRISKETLIKVMNIFSNITFIWKYEDQEDPILRELKANVHTVVWAPQLALLSDKRLTAFVTHAGAGSLQEVASSGTKIMCIPLFADQFGNAGQLERVGAAIVFDKAHLKVEKRLVEAIQRLISDDRLRINAEKLAEMITNRPFSPSEILVKYTEFAGNYGKV